ncbi:MAG: tetratricopeptide repeat protein [Syntrophales bacterium]|nr:tetratricopeptide repeat protein [Syntrophales bacterium]
MAGSRFRNTLVSPWFGLMIIALAAFLVYSNTFECPFVFDDNHSLKENVEIRDLSGFSSPARFLEPRAVVDCTFALNYRFGKLDVFGYHLVNILIHMINGFVVYFLARVILRLLFRPSGAGEESQISKLKAQRKRGKGEKKGAAGRASQFSASDLQSSIPVISLFAALIFIVHPIQTQAVTYVVQRYASLAAFFYMGSVLFYLQARIRQGSGIDAQGSEGRWAFRLQSSAFFSLSILFGLLAFMSKQNAASLPGAIVLVECVCFGGTWRQRVRRFLWVLPFLLLFVAFILYAMGVFGGGGIGRLLEDVSGLARETELVGRWSYLCTQFSVLVVYIRLLFLPINQNLDYLYPFKTGFFDGLTPLAFAFLMGLVMLAVWRRKRYPVVTVAIFWFFITLSVESSIIPIRDALFEHRLYLPLFGFALLIPWLIFRFLPGRYLSSVIICAAIVASLGTATYLRNVTWQDKVTLWTDVVAKSPQNSRACMNLGNALASEGRYDEALRCHSRVLESDPDSAIANYNMGVALKMRGDTDGAVRYYMKTLSIDPDHENAHYNLGLILEGRGDLEGAARNYSEALRINPKNVKAQGNLGVILSRLGDPDRALERFREAVLIEPQDAKALNNLGSALAMKGDIEGAVRYYSEALEITPGYADAHYNLGTALALKGDRDGAIRHLSEAVRIMPDHAKARYDLGNLLAGQGRLDEAILHLSEAFRLRPDGSIPVCYNIACACARQNKREEAIAWLKKAVEGGFNRWELLKSDKDLENIRDTVYYKSLIKGQGVGNGD